ncbi:MAG: hypothetical protein ACE5EN_10365 [Nitrospinota bacterium]
MTELLNITVGIIVAVFSGPAVGCIFKGAGVETRPKEIPKRAWTTFYTPGIDKPGKFLGGLERLLSLTAAWTNSYELIAGWLVFKVASKWEVWGSVIKVPESFPDVPELNSLKARRIVGSRLLV